MTDADIAALASPADDEVSSETDSQRNDTDEESATGAVDDDKSSTTSTEISEAATEELLGISASPATPDLDAEAQPPLGFSNPWGISQDGNYDVITVHGLRDDHRTAWKSKSGKPWLRDRLFQKLSIRQLDYRYATDESARVFQRDGIKAEARDLLRRYSVERCQISDVDRPIIWVCHDVGGTIVKQVLIEAAQATLPEHYDDTETWESMKETRRRISTFSTAIVFLGCPHRAESINVLGDELHNLMSLPGPDVKKGIMRKIRDVALQVNEINIRALDGNMFSRLASINAFYLQDLPHEPGTTQEPLMQEVNQHPAGVHQEDGSVEIPREGASEPAQHPSAPLIEFPTPPASPFSRYTLTTGHWNEVDSRYSQSDVDHASLVRGDEGVEEGKSWVAKVCGRFETDYYPLKVDPDLIQSQIALLSLAPSPRYPSVHMEPSLPKHSRPPFLDWILSHRDKFSEFQRGVGPRILHIHGVAEVSRTAMIAQYLHTFDERSSDWELGLYGGDTFYFEFSTFDSGRNTIRAMLVTFLNEMAWRAWSLHHGGQVVNWMLGSLEYYRCWSLSDLFKLFTEVRRSAPVRNLGICLSCFDSCVAEERTWFLKAVLGQHSHSDLNYRLIIITSNPDEVLENSIPESDVLSLKDCPASPKGFSVDEEGIDASGLAPTLEDVLRRRPALKRLEQYLRDLIDECQCAPRLGYRILDWLGRFGRGTPIASISATVDRLRPVTPENVASVLIGSLPLEKRTWAVLAYRWVRYAMAPLTIEELGHALAASTSSNGLSLMDIDFEQLSCDLEQALSGIIVVDGRGLKFVDESFYEITMAGLEAGGGDTSSSVHGSMAEACLRYLMHDEVQAEYRKLSVENYGGNMLKRPLFLPRNDLLEYAVQHWTEHYRLANSHCPVALALEFFRKSETRNRWAEAHYLLSNPFTRIHRGYCSPLPLMAALGLGDLISHQIEHEEFSEWFHHDGWLAITEAARHGHKDILHSLLDRVQVSEIGLRDAISLATSSGNEEVLRPLVDKAAAMEGFSWPDSSLAHGAFAGSDLVVSALAKTDENLGRLNEDVKQTAIQTAILWGQASVVKLLLEYQTDLSGRDTEGRIPLLLAVHMCEPEIVRMLLGKGANLDDKSLDGVSVVNTAIYASDTESLKALLAAGADIGTGIPDASQYNLRCPITFAAEFTRPACLRILIDGGADPFTESEGGSPLYIICGDRNQIDNCRRLLDKGADPNQTYADKEMMLNRVLSTQSKEMIELFLDKGGKLDSRDSWDEAVLKTPLSFAADVCSFDVLKLLLDRGASVNYVPEGAESALFAAAWRRDDTKKPGLLLERGADIHWKRDFDGLAPLHAAYDEPSFVSLLLEHGADIEGQSEDGTVLMAAARWNAVETLKLLVAHQNPAPDLEAKYNFSTTSDCYGDTALVFAVKNGCYECANCLLEAGAKLVGKLQDAMFILQLVGDEQAEASHKFMKACLDRGIKPDQVDQDGNTALHGIRSLTPASVIQLLIDSGAPVDTPNAAGMTPLAVAVEHGNNDAARLLLAKSARANIHGPKFGSLLFLACKDQPADVTKTLELLKLLIDAGAEPNAPGPEPAHPPLLYTVIRTNTERSIRRKLVRYLMEDAGVHANAPDGAHLHPIIAATEKVDFQLLQYLIRHGASVHVADSLGRRVIHHVVHMGGGNMKRYRLLARANADLQAPDNYGRTPLHLAAGFGYAFEIAWLFRHLPSGVDVNVRDADGWTPLMWACKLDTTNQFAVEELRNRGADIWPKSNDGEWSALKLACLSDMSLETQQLLQPQVGTDGVTETWDPLFHTAEPGETHNDFFCDGCLLKIVGPRYKCTTCGPSQDLCFKCFPHRGTMHDPDHEFEKYVEVENTDSERARVGDDESSDSEGSEDESEDEDEDDARSNG